MRLEKIDGPKCLYCGCTDSAALGEVTSAFGQRQQRRQCRNCGKSFRVAVEAPVETEGAPQTSSPEEPGVVPYRLVRCPACHSENTRVTSTRRPLRQHKCLDCGHPFRSKEA